MTLRSALFAATVAATLPACLMAQDRGAGPPLSSEAFTLQLDVASHGAAGLFALSPHHGLRPAGTAPLAGGVATGTSPAGEALRAAGFELAPAPSSDWSWSLSVHGRDSERGLPASGQSDGNVDAERELEVIRIRPRVGFSWGNNRLSVGRLRTKRYLTDAPIGRYGVGYTRKSNNGGVEVYTGLSFSMGAVAGARFKFD